MSPSVSVRVISPIALTCPAFSAISAITPGTTSSTKASEKSGAWMPTTPAASSVMGGSPNQAASATPDQSTRMCSVTSPAVALNDVIGPVTRSNTQDRT